MMSQNIIKKVVVLGKFINTHEVIKIIIDDISKEPVDQFIVDLMLDRFTLRLDNLIVYQAMYAAGRISICKFIYAKIRKLYYEVVVHCAVHNINIHHMTEYDRTVLKILLG